MGLDNKHVAIASFVGLISWLLITHLIPSFRWIPYAFIAGCLSTVVGLTYLLLTTARDPRRNHAPRTIVPPAFIRPGNWEQEKAALKKRQSYSKRPVYPKSRPVSKAIDRLLDLVIRDFVSSWYKNVSTASLFENEVDRVIRETLVNIGQRKASLDLVEIAVAKIVPTITNHIRDFYNAEHAVRGKNLARDMTESEELELAIAAKYRDGKLHPAASLAFSDTKLMQQDHLRKLVSRILPVVLPENMKSSPAVSSLIREIIACAVLSPVMLMLADPDTFNQAMEAFGRTLLHDRKTVRKLRAALDEHAAPAQNARPVHFPRLRPNDNERQFERFVRAIRHCATLSDARRFRSEVTSQIRKATSAPDQDPLYLKRLETGRRILDQKIAYLAAGGTTRPKLTVKPSSAAVEHSSRLNNSSLTDVLHNSSGLSYFMEFMDRRDRMRLVQFWIVVDGFRNPLEEDADEPEQAMQTPWTPADRSDIEQIYEAYLTKPEIGAQDTDRKAVQSFLKAGSSASSQLYVAARKAVLRTQTSILEEMKELHFDSFKKSDLFYKWLATEEGSVLSAASDSSLNLARSHSNPGIRSPVKDLRASKHLPSQLNRSESELRRPVKSSTDIKGLGRPALFSDASRQLVTDDSRSRPLFDDDIEDERMSQSVPALGRVDPEHETESTEVVDAMQAALDEIMDEPDRDSLFSAEHTPAIGPATNSPRSSIDSGRPALMTHVSKPSIASLGLVGAPSSLGVFSDDLFGEEQRFPQDEREESDVDEKPVEDDIHEAAPGDLGLTEAIDALNADISRLAGQESILESLTRKAELTNNAAELRILRKSKQSLQREIHRREMQKQQYVVQESDNSLYGRAAVNIKSIMVGKEPDGHEYALYVIEVRRQAGDHVPAVTWAVTRRYSEFHELHKRLRGRFPAVKDLEFPRRQTLFTLQKDFLQKRRVILERYLKSLLLIPAICRSRELRAFLSQSTISMNGQSGASRVDERDFVTRIYNSVTDGMEEFLGNIPVLDQLSVAGQNLISAATAQMNGIPMGGSAPGISSDPTTAAEAEAEIAGYEDREAEPFVKPICDLFLEIFELSKGTSWLRGRAVVVVLHQLLGGTIERRVRDAAKGFVQEDSILKYIDLVRESMWPEDQMRQAGSPRTLGEKTRSRKEAGLLLATLIPDMAGSVVGRANAQAASRKVFAILNNPRLNTHLVFTLLDELVQTIFPEAVQR